MGQPTPSTDPIALTFAAPKHTDTYPFIDPTAGAATGLKVLVTGASKGIGRATVLSFAKAGASAIALLARSDLDSVAEEVVQAAKAAGREEPKMLKLRASTTDAASVGAALTTIEQEFGYLDVVINNASRMETWRPLAETDVEDWWNTFEVNLKGTFLITRAAIPVVLKSRLKTIVVITSAGGLTSS
jgi:NAD(P)-dependent dehydrogenase (short-subunit alcohol dehydrogenase family)